RRAGCGWRWSSPQVPEPTPWRCWRSAGGRANCGIRIEDAMSAFPSLVDAAERRIDNFLPLRHLAAWLVIYGHSYPLGNNVLEQKDVLHAWLPGFSISRCAVFLFFAISGYLLTSSLLRHPSVLRYAWHRVLRIYPAYLVCLLLCVLALGACFT